MQMNFFLSLSLADAYEKDEIIVIVEGLSPSINNELLRSEFARYKVAYLSFFYLLCFFFWFCFERTSQVQLHKVQDGL